MRAKGTPPVTGSPRANNQAAGSAKQSSTGLQASLAGKTAVHGSAAAVFVAGEREACYPDQVWNRILRPFLEILEETNRQILESLAGWRPRQPEPCAVPDLLGRPIYGAVQTLKLADLRVRKIAQEYSENIPEGHVVSQIPGSGGPASKQAGVGLVVSKGLPPDKEGYDALRRREQIPLRRRAIKKEVEKLAQAQARLPARGGVQAEPA